MNNKIKKTLNALLPMAVNTVISIVKDKKIKSDEKTDFIQGDDNLENGVSVSSKRLMTVLGAPTLFSYGVSMLTCENPIVGLIIIGFSVIYAVGMAYITHISEKK